jgi:hypothetical protein
VIAAAVLAPNAVSRILDHPERFFHQLDLLDRALVLRSLRRANPTFDTRPLIRVKTSGFLGF